MCAVFAASSNVAARPMATAPWQRIVSMHARMSACGLMSGCNSVPLSRRLSAAMKIVGRLAIQSALPRSADARYVEPVGDMPGQFGRGDPRGGAGYCGGRGHVHGQARHALPRHRAAGPRPSSACPYAYQVSGEYAMLKAAAANGSTKRPAGGPAGLQARWCGRHPHVFRAGCGPLAEGRLKQRCRGRRASALRQQGPRALEAGGVMTVVHPLNPHLLPRLLGAWMNLPSPR